VASLQKLRIYSGFVMPPSTPEQARHAVLLWPCPQCDSVNVKVLGSPEDPWPCQWAQCEDCREVWPAEDVPAF
jgi:hypothetical protein